MAQNSIKVFDNFEGTWKDIEIDNGGQLQYDDTSGWVGVNNKIIRGNISQSGISAPTIDIFENTTGATLSTSRSTDGQYRIDSDISLWTASMLITIGNAQTKNGVFSYLLQYGTDKRLDLYSYLGNALSDECLGNTSFEIKIY
jgi:hypothetical protein